MEIKLKKCKDKECTNEFQQFNSLQKYCSAKCKSKNTVKKAPKKYTIPQKSAKRKKEDAVYMKKREAFLNKPENKICPVTGYPTTEVHHKKGRQGFADEWARYVGIPLYLDERFFLAVSRKGHRKIEENPIWAKEQGYSVDRLN